MVRQTRAPDLNCSIVEEFESCFLGLPNIVSNPDWRVFRLQRFIDDQGGRIGWRLSDVCRELDLGVTAQHVARLFRQDVGLGVREYQKLKRLHIAAIKLRTTSLSVKEIAADLGYNTPADFFRQFKRLFQVTPITFRNVNRSRA